MQQRLIPDDDDVATPRQGPKVLTVTEITRLIKAIIGADDRLMSVTVLGEVFEVSTPSSGHVYFSLKEGDSVLSCILWRSDAQRTRFRLEPGLKVIVSGRIGVYERQGKYQLYATTIKPEGEGALHLAFDQLRRRLEAEGLMAPERKRPIPRFPEVVGVVTSPTGAAIRDIIKVATERWPLAHIMVAPSSVQGDTAPTELVEAIRTLDRMEGVAVMIVSRGGGSLEDLWAFNDERVARAIASASVPVVTGIGHEVDRTISDLVSDRAAATPSQAAELVFPDATKVRADLRVSDQRLASRLRALVGRRRERYDLMASSPALQRPKEMLDGYKQSVDDSVAELSDRIARAVSTRRHALEVAMARLGPLDPRSILERGYSITTDEDGAIIRNATQVDIGSRIKVRLHKGEVEGRVESRKEGDEDV